MKMNNINDKMSVYHPQQKLFPTQKKLLEIINNMQPLESLQFLTYMVEHEITTEENITPETTIQYPELLETYCVILKMMVDTIGKRRVDILQSKCKNTKRSRYFYKMAMDAIESC